MIFALALLAPNLALAASPGGLGGPGAPPPPAAPTESTCTAEANGVASSEACPAVKKARLVGGEAFAPAGAPAGVRLAIEAANSIRTKPYVWGGGHRSWYSSGYDCSGAVSFALHGANLLTTPLDSGSLESWGEGGAGRWITVYANKSHTYAVIAGLRWDTAGNTSGSGPRWSKKTTAAAPGRYVVRHAAGY